MKNQPVIAQVFRLAFSGGLKSHSREKLSIKSDGHFELDLPDSIRFFSAGDIIMIYNDNKMTANIYIYQCIYIYVCVCNNAVWQKYNRSNKTELENCCNCVILFLM